MTVVNCSLTIPEELDKQRLDRALAQLLPDYSRVRIKEWIQQGYVTVNKLQVTTPRHSVRSDDAVEVQATLAAQITDMPEAIQLNIAYEDNDVLIINKQPGLIAHPGAGHPSGTLVNALLHHDNSLNKLPRAGLIHRLDKDTSGLLIIGKNSISHDRLLKMMQQRSIKRQYLAVCQGILISGGTIEEPIGRDPRSRIKMAVVQSGKPAITHYRVIKKYRAHTLLSIELETGRTHQIRVHFTHKGYPLIGDRTYRKQKALENPISDDLKKTCQQFKRQALHAEKLTLTHPISQEILTVEAPIPDDIAALLEALDTDLQA
jgi:23S rRNA pseudouridine1911/1915/1917 synthase